MDVIVDLRVFLLILKKLVLVRDSDKDNVYFVFT